MFEDAIIYNPSKINAIQDTPQVESPKEVWPADLRFPGNPGGAAGGEREAVIPSGGRNLARLWQDPPARLVAYPYRAEEAWSHERLGQTYVGLHPS
jgi:hypothetical protein